MKNLITKNGYKLFIEKINNFKNKKKNLIKEIEIARSNGDLSENSDFKIAKEKKYILEKKILILEKKINNFKIIDPLYIKNKDKIFFSCKLKLFCYLNKKKIKLQIVGDCESNFKKNKISILSKLSKVLIKKKINDKIYFKNKNNKIIKYKIIKIKYD
ncbi:putative transcription elongation factor GreA [Candidatus Zinderia insecticola CARI]|uniref:Transcription elongation factor GreA n=1 Tax=Zinderia insecticola (strain CARI) TaxID=871271 RepID=E0TIV0_ZINIC|nr:putative transcription elongation factor GreA [Candidatus Zinderia insecticola CARI]